MGRVTVWSDGLDQRALHVRSDGTLIRERPKKDSQEENQVWS